MQRGRLKIAAPALTLVLMLATSTCALAIGPGSVSGVVKDSQGAAQMGALVEVLTNGSVIVGTAFTDLHGRYLISNLIPGKYEIRASAALFATALRPNLQLRSGARVTVNITLNALFDPVAWLPAERRKADESPDDWTWTLRSAVNRPVLRMVGDDGQSMVFASSSAAENKTPVEHARAEVVSSDGGFGTGGIHNVFHLDRRLTDGTDAILRVSVGAATGPLTRVPSTEMQAGYQRQTGIMGTADRLVVSYQSHPELMSSAISSEGTATYDVMQLASAHKAQFGDMVEFEAGGDVYFVRSAGSALASRPFLKITAHPTATWSADYRMATSRDLQSFAGLDSVELELPVGVVTQGRMQLENGLHQQWGIEKKTGRGVVQVAYYRDHMNHTALAGIGHLSGGDLAAMSTAPSGVLADTATNTFRLMGSNVRSQGVNLLVTEPITSGLWLAFEYSTGNALTVDTDTALPTLTGNLKLQSAQSAAVAIRGRVVHTGTKVRASYRWQPEGTVTAVNSYGAFSDQAYLSFVVRQPIRCGNLLPAGLEATVDVSNLLAEGYRPILSSDGKTLYLAQMPRAIQAGLAFNF
ncbi:MAG: carboxypeptidase-like regulatory domain-containing protein [Acidobacteriaceae bacterium]|nr:carboxypeptidase-like regulatory domain-containing protein [Acidobacteriaceae bacterium]